MANIAVNLLGMKILTVTPVASLPNIITYQLSFAVTPTEVPEPASAWLLLIAGAGAILYRLRRRA